MRPILDLWTARSQEVTLVAAPALIPTGINISMTPTEGRVPLDVTIQGYLWDAVTAVGLNGKTINLYRDGVLFLTTTTGPAYGEAGYYVFNFTVDTPGTYTFFTEFPGDGTYAGCEAAAVNSLSATNEVGVVCPNNPYLAAVYEKAKAAGATRLMKAIENVCSML